MVHNYWYFVVLHLTVSNIVTVNGGWVEVYTKFCTPLVAFPKNGQNLTFFLKSIVFNHFSMYFQQYKCLFISPIAFTITFTGKSKLKKKKCNIALSVYMLYVSMLAFMTIILVLNHDFTFIWTFFTSLIWISHNNKKAVLHTISPNHGLISKEGNYKNRMFVTVVLHTRYQYSWGNVTVLELLISIIFRICWSWTTWPTNFLMLFLSFSDKLLEDVYIIFKKVDNLEIVHKTCSILVWNANLP